MSNNKLEEIYGKVIHTYSRAESIADGSLIDVSEMAREAGFKLPVAMTRAVWGEYIVPSDEDMKLGQSVEGRLWDTLSVMFASARCCSRSEMTFSVVFVIDGNSPLKKLKAIIGPGDKFEPVLTVMMPEEE